MTKKEISKNAILIYSQKIREIQSKQIDPFIDKVASELEMLYPWLVDRKDGSSESYDWACDIVSSSSNMQVIDVLNRITKIGNERGYVTQDEPPSTDDVINSILDRLSTLEQRISSIYNER